jgi:hypothetical protein
MLGLAIAVTAVAAAWIEEDVRGERQLRRFEQECRDEGKPLDYSFYKPEAVPDAQNLFKAPVIVEMIESSDPNEKLPSDLWKLDLPRLMGHWQRGQVTDFAAAYRVLKAKSSKSIPDSKAGAELILEALEKINPVLDALGNAALVRPDSQIQFRADGYFLPTFRVLRYFTQALTLRAVAEIELGRNDDAFRDVYASYRLAEGAALFPSHIHLMMANVMLTLSNQPFWEGWLRGAWTAAQLKAVQDLLSGIHPLRELPAAFAAGRAYTGSSVSEMPQPRWMPEGWKRLNIVRFFRSGSGGGDPSSFDPVLERIDLNRVALDTTRLEQVQHSNSPFMWLSRNNAWPARLPVFIGAAQNCLTLTRTACALERYRLAYGKYPRNLVDLVPAFLLSVPIDVIDGAPLRYACSDGVRFKLYSIGLNGVDDHGELPGKTENGNTYVAWTSNEGDWAWPQSPAP